MTKRWMMTFLMIAVGTAVTFQAPRPSLAAVVETPIASDCILTCWDEPPYCEDGEHDAWWVESEKHPGCNGMGEGELEELRSALAKGHVHQVERVLEEAGANATVNVARAAIQVFDCNGDVAVHFPIPAAMAVSLSRAIAN
jgi:hypothetical protein